MYYGDIHIGHNADAIRVVEELLDEVNSVFIPKDKQKKIKDGLEALKDALEREII